MNDLPTINNSQTFQASQLDGLRSKCPSQIKKCAGIRMRSSILISLIVCSTLPGFYLEQLHKPLPPVERRQVAPRILTRPFNRTRSRTTVLPLNLVTQSVPHRQQVTRPTRRNEFRQPIARYGAENNEFRPYNVTVRDEASNNQELLCLMKLYAETFASDSFNQETQGELNDRLVFLIPLIIIYWRHKHPHEPVPFREIDIMLLEAGDEAKIHRKVLQEVARRVDRHCYGASQAMQLRRKQEQVRAAEALAVLKNWMSYPSQPDEEFEEEEEEESQPLARQSGAREIRRWFESLLRLNKRTTALLSQRDRARLGVESTRPPFSYLEVSASNRSPSTTTTSTATTTTTTTATTTTTTTPSPESTTEPFGWPHYGNKSVTSLRPHHYSERQPVEGPPVDSSQMIGYGADYTSSLATESPNVTLANQFRDLQSVLSSPEQPVKLNASHYGEFFETISALISEIDSIHNATMF